MTGDSIHGQEYLAALALIDSHVALWPADESAGAEDAA